MEEEIEAKILEINRPKLISRLEALGAKPLPVVRMKMWFYDFPDKRLRVEHITCRVRYEGDKTVLYSKKKISKDKDKCRKSEEHPLVVESAGKACEFLEGLGMVCNFYGEKDRLTYILEGDHVDIDHWPSPVKDYVEVEGSSEELVERTVKRLGLDPLEMYKKGWADVLRKYGVEPDKIKVFKF